MYLFGVTFEFYFNNFIMNGNPTPEALSYEKMKAVTMKKYSSKQTKEKMLRERTMFKYKGEDILFYVNKDDCLYIQAEFNEKSRW